MIFILVLPKLNIHIKILIISERNLVMKRDYISPIVKKTFASALAALTVFTGVITVQKASAAEILPSDSSIPSSGCTFLGIEGRYITQIRESIDLINQIRLEACQEGIENPSTNAPLTTADYYPIQWSSDLEYIARLRAAEASVTMDHARTNGKSIWFEGPNGISSSNEVIAWNWGETMVAGINQWYGEKNDWVNKTGGVTGHYTAMINPNNRYVGLGTFYSKLTRYHNTTVGEFCRMRNNVDTSQGSPTGTIIQTLEVENDKISYDLINDSDSLSLSATVVYKDYWSNTLPTSGLILLENSASSISWSSSNDNVVTVSDGKLTYNAPGSATIRATLSNGDSFSRDVYAVKANIHSNPKVDTSGLKLRVASIGEYTANKDGVIGIPDSRPGTYTFTFSAKNCAPRAYDVTVTDGAANIPESVELHLIGDINGDGKLTLGDVLKANASARNSKPLTGYDKSVADINGDGSISLGDVLKMNAHARNSKRLW